MVTSDGDYRIWKEENHARRETIEFYENTVYQFIEPLKAWISLSANEPYQTKVLQRLKEKILKKGLCMGFRIGFRVDV